MHFGIVLTDTFITEEIVRYYVLELIWDGNSEYTHALARVGHSAFRFHSDGSMEEAYVKNQKRKAERSLLFGDVIEWDDKDVVNRIVSKIRRGTPLFESRVYNGRSQILVNGIVSPIDKLHFWSHYFPNVQLDLKSAQSIIPNIAVSAWLNLSLNSNGKLCIEFDSFENVEEDGSIVASAPWNRNNAKYTTLTVPLNDDDLLDQIVIPTHCRQMLHFDKELVKCKGVYTGNRLIFCKELFSHEIIVALVKDPKDGLPLSIGVICDFYAMWNGYEKKYIVTKYKCEGQSRLGDNGLIRSSIKAVSGYPGIFKSEYYGLVDDPRGALALFHLSPYKDSCVMVTLEDKPTTNSCFRFRIVDVQPDKAPKLQKWVEKNEITMENVQGVVLDMSTVYSRAYGQIVFHFPNDTRIDASPGRLIKFSARYQNSTKKFVITDFSLSENEVFCVEKCLLPEKPDYVQRAFRVSATKSKDFDCFLENEVFGLIDIAGHNLHESDRLSALVVWVIQSPSDSQAPRSARAPFVVVSLGEQEPDEVNSFQERTMEPVMGPTYQSSLNSRVSSVTVLTPEQSEPPINSDLVIQEEIERMGLSEESLSNHLSTCTEICCAANCPTLQTIMFMMDTAPNFLEALSLKNPALFIRCVNQIFS